MARALTLFLLLLAGMAMPPASHAALAAAEEGGGGKAQAKGGGEEGGKGKKSDDVSGGRYAGDPIYVHLDPLIIPIITNSGAEQLVTMVIDIEVKDFDAGDKLHSEMPKVRDSLMRHLYGGLGSGALRHGKMVDVTAIKAKATSAVTEVIGADNVRDVLIQAVGQRVL